MRHEIWLAALGMLVLSASAFAQQGKGVDTQSQTIRDNGNNRAPANNGNKQDTGTEGSGITFGKDKTPPTPLIPNPYRLTSRRDVLLKAVAETMRERKLVLDDAASRLDDGILVSQPYTFIKGSVVTASELSRYATRTGLSARDGWAQGRYTITVEVQAIDGNSSNVSVNAKIEGKREGGIGAQWVTLDSSGTAEQEFLAALIESITGTSPLARPGAPGPMF